MIRASVLTCLWGVSLVLPAASAETQTYKGLCEASTGVFLDEKHFAVASDETNIIRIYTRGDTSAGTESDFQAATGFDKSDIEGSARVGDRIYWLSSNSFNSQGEDKPKRKVFFASKIVASKRRRGPRTNRYGSLVAGSSSRGYGRPKGKLEYRGAGRHAGG